MTYFRKRRVTRRKFGGSKEKLRTKRSARRSSYTARTRRYTRKPVMSKKRILDVTTVKKRDNMQCFTNMTSPQATGNYALQAAIVGGQTSSDVNVNHPRVMLWCATARDMTTVAGSPNLRINEAARTSSTPYMVGLRESVEIQSGNGVPWQWRRICFTYKGFLPGSIKTSVFSTYTETTSGYVRLVNQVPGDRNSGQTYDLFKTIFAGQNATDWNDPMVAKTDQTRISVKYDKTRTLATGNSDGFIRKYNLYHPMGKTLAYDDDENGESMDSSAVSVDSKAGMGDYYVLDLIRSRFAAGTADAIVFNPDATLYWHEK